MKKTALYFNLFRKRKFKVLLVMKLTVILMFLAVFQVSAEGYSQEKISVNFENVKLSKALKTIEKKSDFRFVYSNFVLNDKSRVTLSADNVEVKSLLESMLKNLNLTYLVRPHNLVIIKGVEEDVKDIVVKGKVVNGSTGQPISGASVQVKGSTVGTSTNDEGDYTITAPDDGVLVFTTVGFESQEVQVNNRNTIDVTMNSTLTSLEDVVVVGYGTQRKRDVTGSVKSLSVDDFNDGFTVNAQQMMQGKVPGVNITSASGEPGASTNIIIRGAGTVRSGSSPLFVVDGVPLDNVSSGLQDPMNFINPNDIQSMDILKDASATAIYGSRGANGVVIITTKRGVKGEPQVTYNGLAGVSKISRKLPVFSADEFRKQVVENGGVLDDFGASTDWQDVTFRKAFQHEQNVSLSGGGEKSTYFASLNMSNHQGILRDSRLKKYSARLNATQKVMNDRLEISINLVASNVVDNRPFIDPDLSDKIPGVQTSLRVAGLLGSAFSNNPTLAPRDADGNPAIFNIDNNPLLETQLFKDIATTNRILGNVTGTLKLLEGLTYKVNFGVDNATGVRDFISYPFEEPFREGRFESDDALNRNWLIENYLTYQKELGENHFTVLGGHSYQNIFHRMRGFSVNQLPLNGLDPRYNPGIGQSLSISRNAPIGSADLNEIQSFFGRVEYRYQNKYLATVNFRADGSSKFGENHKYGYFPSFSLGWNIDQEEFFTNSVFTNLKIRGGWGSTGNQEIPPKLTQALFLSEVSATSSYPLDQGNNYPAGVILARLANPNLRWEKSNTTNIGIDFGLLNGALTGTIDLFEKVSENILLAVPPIDPIQPANQHFDNINGMKIRNKGIEIDLAYRKRVNDSWSLGFGGNSTFIRNRVSGSPYQLITTGDAFGTGLTGATVNGYLNGYPIGTFYMLKFTGIGPDGMNAYVDTNDDGFITADDRQAVGTALPKVNYGVWGNIIYKDLSFSFSFNGVAGNKIYDNTATSYFTKSRLVRSSNTTKEAIEFPNESIVNPGAISTRFLKPGGYLRLNNLSLTYNLNVDKLGIDKVFKGLSVSLVGQNVFVITQYNGYDPEINRESSVDNIVSYGIDYLSYPHSRSVIFGLRASF